MVFQLERNDEPTVPSLIVENLGIMFDEYLTFDEQIDSVVKVCNSHLRNLYVIASKLSYELKRQLIHCLIFSKLDYCNGLFYMVFLTTSLKSFKRSKIHVLGYCSDEN